MIRKATNADFKFICDLYMGPESNRFLLYEQMSAIEFKPVFDELLGKQILYVYEADETPAGMCKLVPQQYRNSHILYLGGVAVHPFFAGKGAGFKMMQDIIVYAREKGFLRIELTVASVNEKAIRLYEKAGFVQEGLLKKFTYLKSEDRFIDEIMMACLLS